MATDTSQVIVVPSTLEGWKLKMTTLNTKAIQIINSFDKEVSGLDNDIRGKFSASYIQSVAEKMEEAKAKHENMKNVETMLQTIVDSMERV